MLKTQRQAIISSLQFTNNQQQYSLGVPPAHECLSLQAQDSARRHMSPGPGAFPRTSFIPPLCMTSFPQHIASPQQHCAARTLPAPMLDTGFLMSSHQHIYSQTPLHPSQPSPPAVPWTPPIPANRPPAAVLHSGHFFRPSHGCPGGHGHHGGTRPPGACSPQAEPAGDAGPTRRADSADAGGGGGAGGGAGFFALLSSERRAAGADGGDWPAAAEGGDPAGGRGQPAGRPAHAAGKAVLDATVRPGPARPGLTYPLF